MNVLSLFDGISAGQLALQRANINVSNYYVSEIDMNCIKVTHENFRKTNFLGDIKKISKKDINKLQKIDLLIGGSPCQDLSIISHGKGLKGDKSGLFYYYLRIFRYIKPKYFLLENTPMQKHWEDEITECLGVKPVLINSSLVSAQDRKRLYWTNIDVDVNKIKDKGLLLKDIVLSADKVQDKYWLDNYTYQLIDKDKRVCALLDKPVFNMSKRVYNVNYKAPTLITKSGGYMITKIMQNNRIRQLTPLEYERLQTFPDNYTNKHISDTYRYSMLGNSWTVDIITEIFKNIK